jgi:hypothetical protein
MASLGNWISQVGAVTATAVRTIPERRGSSAATVFGIAGVVAVFVAVLSIGEGFRKTLREAGTPGNAMIMRSGSDSEMMSVVFDEALEIIAQTPGVARGAIDGAADAPLSSGELFVIVDLPSRATGATSNVPLRGVQPAAFSTRPDLKITSGRKFEWGKSEILVGEGALRTFRGLELGSRLRWGKNEWTVVGTFAAGGALWESELWTDARVLQPAYRINGDSEAEERELAHLSGFNGDGPVRIGNQAFEHVQNDVYGEMVLAVSRLFLDARFVGEVPRHTAVEMIQGLVDQMDARLEEPDAGLWEFRGKTRLHSFSVLMHWAGSRRAAEVGDALEAPELAARARAVEERARDLLESQCWNDEIGALTQVAGEPQLDAALLLAVHLGFFAPDDPRALRHVDAIRSSLSVDGGLLRRYTVQDDFGHMEAAFTVCTFWLVEALALIGRTDEARALFDRLLSLDNGLGLYSEDILPDTLEQSGNFPQTYSHVGLINAAFRLSRRWD